MVTHTSGTLSLKSPSFTTGVSSQGTHIASRRADTRVLGHRATRPLGHSTALELTQHIESRAGPLKRPSPDSSITKTHSFLPLLSALRKPFQG